MAYWLFKSEPSVFSIDDLSQCPHQTGHWEGVRNYQARNMLRDQIKKDDLAFFYHSSCTPPGIVGIVKIVKEGYPDFTAWDKNSPYYDPKSSKANPRWFMVDVQWVKKFRRLISLDEIKSHHGLKRMHVTRKGNRLSITSVTEKEWQIILEIENIRKKNE